ncbi:hypothetical protein MAPG_05609 [Magnaporthiopsis poae ATCC 64411]|uniref:N-acetyltransferase domain-containing protein n=1 Tax=Magnaporthiopsis poae (strain ATCC 64411 / 73-15) TaxID=644358 RepID=A0A0C4DZV1_MAGP6|nr:hypothetical protein MAPG_05609 [Magnaporthiopsis poae ATCC 64411]
MELELSTPTANDCGRMAEIHVRAMEANPLLHAQFPTSESVRRLEAFLAEHYASIITPRSPARSRVLVAQHLPSRQIASFATWDVPAEELTGEVAEEEKLESGDITNLEGCQKQYLEKYAALSAGAAVELLNGEKCYHLNFVCTDPEFQRMGAGEALTRAVMAAAQADGMRPVYLESTAVAVGLYKRLGFVTLGDFGMEIPKRGSTEQTEDYREVCMVWRPTKME